MVHADRVRSAGYLADDQLAYSVCRDGTIRVWDEWHCRDVIGARIGLGVARGCFFDPAKLGIDID
jgi:hypothetical protein